MKYSVRRIYVDYQIWDDIDKLGVSYSELARLTGLDRSNFAHMKKDKYPVEEATYKKIRAAVDKLLTEAGQK